MRFVGNSFFLLSVLYLPNIINSFIQFGRILDRPIHSIKNTESVEKFLLFNFFYLYDFLSLFAYPVILVVALLDSCQYTRCACKHPIFLAWQILSASMLMRYVLIHNLTDGSNLFGMDFSIKTTWKLAITPAFYAVIKFTPSFQENSCLHLIKIINFFFNLIILNICET